MIKFCRWKEKPPLGGLGHERQMAYGEMRLFKTVFDVSSALAWGTALNRVLKPIRMTTAIALMIALFEIGLVALAARQHRHLLVLI